MPSFTNYRYMIGTKFKKTGHVIDQAHSGVICRRRLRLWFDTIYLHAKFDHSSFSRSGDTVGAHQDLSGLRELTTPLSVTVCHPQLAFATVNLPTKFQVFSLEVRWKALQWLHKELPCESVSERTDFKNRSTFAKVMIESQVYCFERQCSCRVRSQAIKPLAVEQQHRHPSSVAADHFPAWSLGSCWGCGVSFVICHVHTSSQSFQHPTLLAAVKAVTQVMASSIFCLLTYCSPHVIGSKPMVLYCFCGVCAA